MAITKTYDLLNINGVKGWIRDSWARRAIAALQQRVAGIVVPTKTSELANDSGYITSADVPPGSTASSTTPLMDGTAAVGTENAFARGDHRHPTDTSRQAALNTAQLAAVNSGITAAKVQEWDEITVPTKTSELTNDSGFITSAPVASVNGQTGVVSLDAADVGALPDSTVVPSKTSQLTNDSGYITAAPVTSVNGKTGAVNLTASDVGALPSSTAIPSKTSDLTNDSGYITSSDLPSVPSPSTANPKMDGTASAGSSAAWARGDHVHPHDTSKANKATTLSGYGITNAYTKTEVDNLIPAVPTNVSAFTNDAGYVTASAVPDASSATPAMDGTGAAGASADYARADHVHPSDTSKQDALTTAQLAAVNSGITASDLAVNDASVLCTVTPIEPTLTTGVHYATYGRCYYYKIGHRVHIHIGVSGLTANTANDLWGMPVGYRPYTMVSVVGTGGNISQYGRTRIATNGMVSVSANATYACVDVEYDAFQ